MITMMMTIIKITIILMEKNENDGLAILYGQQDEQNPKDNKIKFNLFSRKKEEVKRHQTLSFDEFEK